jgi:hypothetical protein
MASGEGKMSALKEWQLMSAKNASQLTSWHLLCSFDYRDPFYDSFFSAKTCSKKFLL